MRKSIDGLAAIVELELERSPFAPALFVFCNRQRGSVKGAQNSARWYSVMETAKANDLEPYRYLKWMFEHLPLAKTETDIDKLPPWNIEPDTIG